MFLRIEQTTLATADAEPERDVCPKAEPGAGAESNAMDAHTCRVSKTEKGRVSTALRLPQVRALILTVSLTMLNLAALGLAGSSAAAVPRGGVPAASPAPNTVKAPVPALIPGFKIPRFKVRALDGHLVVEMAATPPEPQRTPHDLDQAAVAAFNPNMNAVNIIVGSFRPISQTPHNADQVFTSVFNQASNAIQVNCISGCGGSSNPGGSSGELQYNSSSTFGGFTLAGDCSLSVPNITCNRTNGAAFAPSATTDATNASNISSGTLAAGRLPSTVTQTNQSNTYSSGTQDFSTATSLKVPVKADATTPANGQIAYDSTANVPHMAVNSADAKVATFTATPATGNCVKWINGTQVGDQGAACGSVTSVGLALPSIFAISGSPVTGGGTLTGTLSSQPANTFFAGPSGSAGTPTFRAIAAADIPTLNQSTTGNAATATALAGSPGQCSGSNFATGISPSGTANCLQPAFSNLSGSLAIAQTPLTSLGDILYVNSTPALTRLPGNTSSNRNFLVQTGTGTASAPPSWGALASGDLPPTIASNTTGNAATATVLAGSPGQCSGGQFATGINPNGSANCSTPSGGNPPGGSTTAVQYNTGSGFGGDTANFYYNTTTHSLTLAGPVSASSFVSTGAAPGTTSWSAGAMSAGAAGTVVCGANTGNVFSCSDNGGAVFCRALHRWRHRRHSSLAGRHRPQWRCRSGLENACRDKRERPDHRRYLDGAAHGHVSRPDG